MHDLAFAGCVGLVSLRLPASLTHLSPDAFTGCAGRLAVHLPPGAPRVARLAHALTPRPRLVEGALDGTDSSA